MMTMHKNNECRCYNLSDSLHRTKSAKLLYKNNAVLQ